jgi:vitamin B12 transporter
MPRLPRSILAALLSAPSIAFSQTDTARIAPVVVTATRVPIDVLSSPATVAVVSGDDLRRRGVTSIAVALQSLPGLTFAQNGSFGATTSLFLRGGESKYVKVLIDGVPVNDPGGAIDFGTLTTDNVERIEVVRGPASVLYGADAVTGVVQIFTRRGRGAPRTIVSVRGGTYGSRDADATMLGAVGSGDYSLSAARHDTKGIYDRNSQFGQTVGSGSLRFAIDPKTDVRVSVRYSDNVFHYPTNSGGTVADTNARNTSDRTVVGLDLTRTFSSAFTAQLNVSSEGTAGGTDDRPDNKDASGFQSVDRTRRRSADLRGNAQFGQTTATVGLQAEQQDQHNEYVSTFGSFPPSTSIFRASRRNTGLYAQTLSRLPMSVVITAGARHDDNERFGKFDTYRVGASWASSIGTHVRASTGSAFREPTFAENYSTGYVTGNPNLKPERSATWEVGLRQSFWADRASIGVTHFNQRFRNMIDYIGSTTKCGYSYCNQVRVQANGREFEVSIAPTTALHVDANLTHLETRVDSAGFDSTGSGLFHKNEQLIRRPTTSWNVGAGFNNARGSVDLRFVHVGDRPDRDFRPYPAKPVVVDAFTRTDLSGVLPLAQFAPRLDGAELTLRVENLFDKEYQSVFNFLTPRRMVLVGARMTF